jgi:hypothetical protein
MLYGRCRTGGSSFGIANSSQLSRSSQSQSRLYCTVPYCTVQPALKAVRTVSTDCLYKLSSQYKPHRSGYSSPAKLGRPPVRSSSLAFGLMGNYHTKMIKYTVERFTVPWIHNIAIFVGAKVAPDLVGIRLLMRRLNTVF